MGKNCEQMQELLVELVYDELDPVDEDVVEAHLEECDECARRAQAFRAVRTDLQAWDEVEPQPSRVTFVPMSASRSGDADNGGGSYRWLPIAASFLLGLLLTAAVANLGIGGIDDRGTGVDPSTSTAVPAATDQQSTARPSGSMTPVSQASPAGGFATREQLDTWLDDKLAARGLTGEEGAPAALPRNQVVPVLEDLIAERDREIRDIVRQMVAESERRQREQFDAALAGFYQTLDSQRTNDLVALAGQLGLLEEATGQELQRTNAAIDYLITQVANSGQRGPERRDE